MLQLHVSIASCSCKLQLHVALASCSCMLQSQVALACRGGQSLGSTVTIRSHKLQFQVAVPSHGGLGLGSAIASRSCKAQLQVIVTNRPQHASVSSCRLQCSSLGASPRQQALWEENYSKEVQLRGAAAKPLSKPPARGPQPWARWVRGIATGRALLPRAPASGQSRHVRVMALYDLVRVVSERER